MTAYNGQAITYDEIGNPASIGSRSFTWQNGRQLASQTYNGSTWTYSYNNAGLRTSRSNGVKTYHYVYNGDKLTQMTIVDEVNHTQQVMDFTYDANGQLLTMTYDEEVYYYILSLQGDVAGITDSQGNRLIDFHYEGYGAGYYTSYDTEKAALLAQINPFGYRSYVMDLGTGMYYLQSRYYDPTLGRFISADTFASTGQGLIGSNMYAYCLNNPVNLIDTSGCYVATITIAGVSISVTTLAKILVVLAVVAVWSDPNVQEVISRGAETIYTGINKWRKDYEKAIREKIEASLAKRISPSNNDNYEIHHIVPKSDYRGALARFILQTVFSEGVEFPMNKVPLSYDFHRRLHTNIYFEFVNATILQAYKAGYKTKADQRNYIIGALAGLRAILIGMDLATQK